MTEREQPEQSISVVLPQTDRAASTPRSEFGHSRGASLVRIVRQFVQNDVKELSPSDFSVVMATGIVSMASHILGFSSMALCLFALNTIFFIILWVLILLRVYSFHRRMIQDLCRHSISPGYLTIVAGTCIFGQQLVTIVNSSTIACWLWFGSIALWLLITYSVLTAMIIVEKKPSMRNGLSGVWLIFVVATQSISVLGTSIAPHFSLQQEMVLFISIVFFMMGCLLYFCIITMIFSRLTFMPLTPADATPTYWINMGATAITVQASTALILHGSESQGLIDLLPFLKGFALLFWSVGTWWIPLLTILGLWVHIVRRVPVTYNPQLWAMVFPIGMYTASTYQLARATQFELLLLIPKATIFLAIFIWALTFAGLLRRIARNIHCSAALVV